MEGSSHGLGRVTIFLYITGDLKTAKNETRQNGNQPKAGSPLSGTLPLLSTTARL